MKIIELILADGIFSGIEAISLVESPAIEEDFIALKSQEVKLAEVSSEKRILMGALLVPNKPIYRKNAEEDYYIYFSKKTIEKASQLYLMNGNQNNTTLEHLHKLKGLTLVESWLVEDEVHDKSRKYGLDVPVGTWMGAVKVNSDEVWDEYVKTGKVKGFSIEGYFADKAERPKETINDLEMKAEQQLSSIRSIIKKGERVELGLVDDAQKKIDNIFDELKRGQVILNKAAIKAENAFDSAETQIKSAQADLEKIERAAKDLGIDIPNVAQIKKSLDSASSEQKRLKRQAVEASKI